MCGIPQPSYHSNIVTPFGGFQVNGSQIVIEKMVNELLLVPVYNVFNGSKVVIMPLTLAVTESVGC